MKQGDEIQFVFGEPLDNPQDYLIEEKEFSKAVMKLWSQFAGSGAGENVTGLTVEKYSDHQTLITLNPVTSGLETVTEGENQKCRFWNKLFNKLIQDSGDKDCKPREKTEKPVKSEADVVTNEVPDSYRRSSTLYVDQPQLPSAREERGLFQDSHTNPHQFVFKVRSKQSNNKQSGSTSAYLEKSYNRQKVFKRQLKPENNTQLSYQLSVGLNNGNSQTQPFAVYNTQNLGNSPIYIAPNTYAQQDPIFNDDSYDGYHGVGGSVGDRFKTQKNVVRAVVTTTETPATFSTFSQSSYSTDPMTGYDPFFPSFGAKIKKSPAVQAPVAGVSLKSSPQPSQERPRSYFPTK